MFKWSLSVFNANFIGTDRDPVPVIDFVAYVERMHSNQDYPFSEEFRVSSQEYIR